MTRLGKYFSMRVNQEISHLKHPDEKHYHREFENETERDVNAFKLLNCLNKKLNQQIGELETDS